jgi:hypothetical protein
VSQNNGSGISGVAEQGGGIYNSGVLNLSGSLIAFNHLISNTGQSGGGIYNTDAGTVNATNSVISDNTLNFNLGGQGGGIASRGTLNITDCTIAGNMTGAGFGSGINNGGTATITRSTFFDNFGPGALFNNEIAHLVNCTFSANRETSGAAIFNLDRVDALNCTFSDNISNSTLFGPSGSAWVLNNCIVANTVANVSASPRFNMQTAGTVSGTNNLFDDASAPAGLSGTIVANPKLLPFAYNGGATYTYLIAADSPARNAGSNGAVPGAVTTDQRGSGFDRIVGGTVDVGSTEYQNALPVANIGGPYGVAEGGSITLDASGSSDANQTAASLAYAWDLDNDGQYDDATGISPTFSAALIDGPATQTIGLQVTDDAGESSTASTTIAITNAAPTAGIGGAPANSPINVPIHLTGSFTDPAAADTIAAWTWTILRDGQAFTTGTTQAFSFTPNTLGVYSISLVITDDDGGISAAAVASIHVTGSQIVTDPGGGGTSLLVSGGSGNDTIVVSGGNGSNVTVTINGVSAGTFAPTGRMIVLGGGGDDAMSVANKLPIPVMFYGEAGSDTLAGGSAAAILIGGDGDDVIVSDSGKDLLIGGNGSDNINGGKGDDILIGARTSYDTPTTANIAALVAIQEEWLTSQNYNRRTGHVAGTLAGGANGSAVFNSTTVFDDGVADLLSGAQGQDWFFGRSGEVLDVGGAEVLVVI